MIPYVEPGTATMARYKVRVVDTYWEQGQIVTVYAVLVPDRTISGDFRHERVVVRQESE